MGSPWPRILSRAGTSTTTAFHILLKFTVALSAA